MGLKPLFFKENEFTTDLSVTSQTPIVFVRDPESDVQRWNKIEITHGGVEVCYQMIEFYGSFLRTRKWTLKAILHLFDLAIVSSWMDNRVIAAVRTFKVKYLVAGTKKRDLGEIVEEENVDNENTN